MADINMKMGTYRVVAISVNTNAPDYLAQTSAGREFLLYQDGPSFAIRTFKAKAITTDTLQPDVLGVVSGGREFLLYKDAPNFAMRMYKAKAITTTTMQPDVLGVTSGARMTFVIAPPLLMASAMRTAFIIQQAEAGVPVYYPQAFSQALQKADWPTLAGTFSTTSEIQTAQLAAIKNTDNAFIWSQTRAAEMVILTLHDRPVAPAISYNISASVVLQVLRASPIDTQSWKSVISLARLTLISLDRVPVPTSGSFVQEFTTLALQSKPMGGMPKSFTQDGQVAALALQRRVDNFPRSKSSVVQNVTLVLRPNTSPLARGPEMAAQHFTMALQANPMPAMNDPAYHAPAAVVQDFQLTLMKQALAFPWIGIEQSRQSAIKVLQKSIVEPVFGVQHDKLLTTLVLQSSPMQKPGSMSGANMPEIRSTVLMAKAYPSAAGIRSMTTYNQVGLQWLVGATYQKPGDVIAGTKFSYYDTLHIQSLIARVQPLPWSITRVPEMSLLSVMHAEYDPPMKVFNDGLFITLIGEQVMSVEQYPTTGVPTSQLIVDSLLEQVVASDDAFPSKSYSTSDLEVTSVVEQVVAGDDAFPDKDLAQSQLQVSQVGEQVTEVDGSFPNPNTVLSQLVVSQVVENLLARAGDYPPKDMVQSSVIVTSLVENVAARDTFPDKDMPQSAIAVSQVAEVVMVVDDSMKGMPQYQGRRKPTIFVQIVY